MPFRKFLLFILIAGLMALPYQGFGATAKKTVKKSKAILSKKHSSSPSSSAKLTGKKESSQTAKARKSRNLAQKKAKKKIARQTQQAPEPLPLKDEPPLLKITPLDNGKFLLERMDSSVPGNRDHESLSLIKKPVFEEQEPTAQGEVKKSSPTEFFHLIVRLSQQLLGKSYRLGGSGQGNDGIDCSGLVKRIYNALTLSLPHSSREQAKLGSLVTTELDLSRLKIGDLLFFRRNRGSQISHTGIYIGDGKMIHSASKKGVIISDLEKSDYYNRNFVVAKRLFILQDPPGEEFKKYKEPLEPVIPSPVY
jgi:cell wall-associated NlpC family hydrolase